ncbi:MAG: M28 family peptidase [Acidobacteria bacterium]|nr:M28 family peptidase [Acidobacteriota bacterium]
MPKKALFGLAALSTLAIVACRPVTNDAPADEALGLSADVYTAAERIEPDVLRETIARLSSDEFEGRGPASPADTLTQSYLSSLLSDLGYSPGAPDGSWLQPFDIVSITSTAPGTWTFSSSESTVDLTYWDEFIAASGVQEESASIDDAQVVFVGYGIRAPEFDWDDYKSLDVSGKVLLVLNNDPDWDAELFAGERRLYYGRWDYKYAIAAEFGAVGVIIIHTTPSAGYPYQVVQTSWTGAQFELPAAGEPRAQIEAWVTEEAAAKLVAAGGHELEALVAAARSRDFEPVELGLSTSLHLANELSTVQTANVVGLLEGSDPKLDDEVVIYTAHHDHLGIGEPDAGGDTIYNGALDNASGVAQVTAIAAAIKALPEAPRRSTLILFVAAEEQGLLGSAYYARHPTFHPGAIAANINLDGGNIWGRTSDLTYIGYGKSSLDRIVDAAARRQDRIVRPDQFPDRGYFYRSDQFSFAQIGVPAIFLDSGTSFIGRPEGWGHEQIEAFEAERYHQPSDELDESWNFDGMVDDARLAFYCGMSIAQADEMPTWNEGDEFEAARLEALADRP